MVDQPKLSRYSCCSGYRIHIYYMSHRFGTGRLYVRIQLTLLILQFYEIRTLNGQISSPPTCPKMSQIKVVCGKEASVGRWSEALKWIKSGFVLEL